MAFINHIPETWTAAEVAEDEIWQCRSGQVLLTWEADPEPNDGLLLEAGAGIAVGAGSTVRYRRAGGSVAAISREVTG